MSKRSEAIRLILAPATLLGYKVLLFATELGSFLFFMYTALLTACTTKPKIKKMIYQMERIGVSSSIIVMLTGGFAGAVLAFQSYIGFKKYGSQDLIGPLIALSMARELGPVLTGLMVGGRAGSAIAAEIGTMRITEQIDALRTLSINVWQYLMVPRILAGIIILPLLALFGMVCGIIGGYVIATHVLNLNGELYITGIQRYLELSDILNGMLKASFFGFILTTIGCYKGFQTLGGARGVGISTTGAVVISSVLMLISNYFLTILLFE